MMAQRKRPLYWKLCDRIDQEFAILSHASRSALKSMLKEMAEDGSRRGDQTVDIVGQKGGLARSQALSPERRKEIASKAAQTRWHKRRPKLTTK